MLCSMAQERNKNEITGQKWCQAQHRNLYGGFARRIFKNTTILEPDASLRSAVEHSLKLYKDKMGRKGSGDASA